MSTPAEPMGGATPESVAAEVQASGATASEVDVAALQARIDALEAAQAAAGNAPREPGADLADHIAAKVAAHPNHELAHLAELGGEDLVHAIEAFTKDHPEVDLSYVLQLAQLAV